MGRTYDEIDDHLRGWIARQTLFFVGTAPLSGDGHVNVSPKGPIGALTVLGPREIAYLDVVGSGAETIAHLRENRRIVVMLCAFEGPPRILRLHGRGEVLLPGDAGFDALLPRFAWQPEHAQARRAVVRVAVTRIADSCGYGVALMEYVAERPQRTAWVDRKLSQGGDDALLDYMAEKNAVSLDGLPAVEEALLRHVPARG